MMLRTHGKGKPQRKYLFSFDENGEHDVDVSKVPEPIVNRLKKAYEVADDAPKFADLDGMKRNELFSLANELGVEVKLPIKNADLRKAIKEVM